MTTYDFTSDIWRWDARREDWFFATVPADVGDDIRELPLPPRGFNSVRVRVRIGGTEWRTSIFPNGDGTFALPLKRAVRAAEDLEPGGVCRIRLEVADGFSR